MHASDENSGLVNWNVIKGIDSSFGNYPAFKWVHEIGEGWYIPAKNEVIAFRDFWQADRTGVNDKSNTAGGATLLLFRAVKVF